MSVGPIGLITVTFNPGETITSLLDSVSASTTREVVVLVSDNDSTDGSLAAIENRDGVQVLRNGANLGYGRAVNAAFDRLPAEADPILIVNPDVWLSPGCLDELLAGLQRHPEAAAVGPLITTPEGKLYPSARNLPSIGNGVGHALAGWWWPTNPWTKHYRLDHEQPIERTAGWLSGSCLLIRREAFAAIGGFDSNYFMYFEDVDLGKRLGEAGWSSVYVPSAAVVHIGGHSASQVRPAMARAHHDSAYRYLASAYSKRRHAPLRVMLRAGLAARSVVAQRSPKVGSGAQLPDQPSD